MKYRVKHFALDEFRCKHCGEVKVSRYLVFTLDIIRRAAGVPVVVSSGFRCDAHNRSRKVRGSPSSRHLIGCAADIIKPDSLSFDEFAEIAGRFGVEGGEFILYPKKNFIHLSVPRDFHIETWDGEGVMTI